MVARLNEQIRSLNSAKGKNKIDVCVTTYEAYRADHKWFKTQRWNILVLDEGHRIRHANTETSHVIQGQGSLYRLSKPFIISVYTY